MKQLFLIVLSVLIFSFCSTNQEQSSKNEDIFIYNKFEEKYDITLLDEEVNEMGVIKAQIAQRVYFGKADSSLSKDEIELYLNQRLKKLDKRKGFKNFSNASHVVIWLHASNDHAAEGGANWIAMINKFGEEDNATYIINEDKLDYFKSPTNDSINNISEENRKEIFRSIVYIEDKSLKDANLKFPDPNDWERHFDFQDTQYNKYLIKLLKHYEISDDIRLSIMSEGIKKGWLEKMGVISLKL